MIDIQSLKKIISAIKFKFDFRQSDIAEKMGVNKTYLSSVINGNEILSELFLDKLVSAFSVSREYLNTGQGEVFEADKKEEQKPSETVTMSREVFDQITRLTETVLSQQRTIEEMQNERKKMLARVGDNAISAVANG